MIIFGVDVGVTGAIAAVRDDGAFMDVRDLPVMNLGKTKWIDGAALLSMVLEMRNGREARAVVEHIHATPKMGCTTGHSLGLTLGSVLATLQNAHVPLELVVPQVWKKALSLISPGASDREKKLASLSKARMLFPSAPLQRHLDNGRAEALLIAHFAQRHLLVSRPQQREAA